MRISKIICDCCGKEITGDPIMIFAERVDKETGDFVTEGHAGLYAPDKDFCDECFKCLKHCIDSIICEDGADEENRFRFTPEQISNIKKIRGDNDEQPTKSMGK